MTKDVQQFNQQQPTPKTRLMSLMNITLRLCFDCPQGRGGADWWSDHHQFSEEDILRDALVSSAIASSCAFDD